MHSKRLQNNNALQAGHKINQAFANFAARLDYKIYFASYWSAKFILRLIGVQNLFCVLLECKIYFASYWSALLFCVNLECKIYESFYLFSRQNKFGTKSRLQNMHFQQAGNPLWLPLNYCL